MFRCPPFDLNDRDLIQGAHATGRPEHIAKALEAACAGFRERLSYREPPVVNGEALLLLTKPANFFDDYCQVLVLQEISNQMQLRIARIMAPGPPDQKQPATPDVEFLPP